MQQTTCKQKVSTMCINGNDRLTVTVTETRQAHFLDAGLIEVDEGDEGEEIGNVNINI